MAEKILIVEDELVFQETLAYNLKHQGYEVETASDGQTGAEPRHCIHSKGRFQRKLYQA